LALHDVLRERGYSVRCEKDTTQAFEVMKEFNPDVMITASATEAFISRRDSAEIVDLASPVDTCELFRVLEGCPGDALIKAIDSVPVT